ncbi:MAG: hypothetical protein ACTHU0_04090 [Kofleriaceae bacterium]
MTPDPDDAAQLAALGRALPTADVEPITAEQIARHARLQVGKGPPKARLLLPILSGAVLIGYAAYAVLVAMDVLR